MDRSLGVCWLHAHFSHCYLMGFHFLWLPFSLFCWLSSILWCCIYTSTSWKSMSLVLCFLLLFLCFLLSHKIVSLTDGNTIYIFILGLLNAFSCNVGKLNTQHFFLILLLALLFLMSQLVYCRAATLVYAYVVTFICIYPLLLVLVSYLVITRDWGLSPYISLHHHDINALLCCCTFLCKTAAMLSDKVM